MRPVAAIKGLVIPPVHTSLSMLDAKAAFTAAQRTPESGDAASARAVVELSEFQTALALCGAIKYEEVEGMSLAQRVAGIIPNFLGEKDEQQVITQAIVPKVTRFEPEQLKPPPHVSAASHLRFLAAWRRMDLSRIHGFPLWERPVFVRLLASFDELDAFFAFYAAG